MYAENGVIIISQFKIRKGSVLGKKLKLVGGSFIKKKLLRSANVT